MVETGTPAGWEGIFLLGAATPIVWGEIVWFLATVVSILPDGEEIESPVPPDAVSAWGDRGCCGAGVFCACEETAAEEDGLRVSPDRNEGRPRGLEFEPLADGLELVTLPRRM